ncbi:MAG TPA: asparaginase [Pyrinomonadaceae bacterium]|nr:asparaginase [Pyrinomonadaceae bacterium]
MSGESSNDDIPVPAPLAKVTRGSLTESRHRGHVVAVDGDGRVVARLGAPETVSFLRSACKAHQAVPLVASGAAERFGFDERELALACGSHNGEPAHTETALSMLRKIGLDASALRCGPQKPYSDEAAERLRERGEKPTPLHNNCSGKHAGMLALAVHSGADVKTYERPEHPAQLEIARCVARFAGMPVEDMAVGVDGCAVPTFGVTVRAMALMSVRLVAPDAGWDEETKRACRRLVAAVQAHPEMVEGDGELDTELMRRAGGRLVSKVGAEGVYTAAVLPSERWPRGLGLAFKLEDGDRKDRARSPVAVECLRQLGALDAADVRALAEFAGETLKNHRGDTVGEVRAEFELELLDS